MALEREEDDDSQDRMFVFATHAVDVISCASLMRNTVVSSSPNVNPFE
jgi:hypothetical protein